MRRAWETGWSAVYRFFYKKLVRPIFVIRSSPHSIALGTSLGLFISLTPTVGFQMLLVLVIGTMIGANRIIAILLCWISNPITFLPMYYGYYYLGVKILGLDPWTFGSFQEKMNQFLETSQDLGYRGTIEMLRHDIIWPLWVGSLIIAVVTALPAYPLTRFLLKRFHRKRDEKRRARRARFLAEQASGEEAGMSRKRVRKPGRAGISGDHGDE